MKDQRLGPCVSTTYLELILFGLTHLVTFSWSVTPVVLISIMASEWRRPSVWSPVDLDDIVPESYASLGCLAPWGDLKVESKG